MSSLYYNHGAMRLYANSPQICMLPSCSSVPYHQQDICCQRVSSSCSNQCASFSTSLWATLIRRRKNVLSYLFMTSFSILHSSFLHWGSACTAHSTATLKEGLILNGFLVILFFKRNIISIIIIFTLVRRKPKEKCDGISLFYYSYLCNKVDENPLCG